jgi:hypothetical protein
MNSQIQCQAITLKGTQCSRKPIVCTSFCTQHTKQSLQVLKNEPKQETIVSNIVVHGPRSCVFKHKPFIKISENQCCFKNTLGEFVCNQKKYSDENFCKHHRLMFSKQKRIFHLVANKIFDHVRTTTSFEGEMMLFNEYAREMIQFNEYFVIFSQDKIVQKFIDLFHAKHDVARDYSEIFPMFFEHQKLSEIRVDVENLCVSRQIEAAKQKIKINEIKLNMLSEIYIKSPQSQSKQTQAVFSNLVTEKIFSMLF